MAILLFVDDDRDSREIFEALFEDRHRVLLASGGQEAFELAVREHPDAAVVDLGLERAMAGLDLVLRLGADPRTRDIPVGVMTGRAGAEEEVRRAGCRAFLLKPVALRDLEGAVETLLAARP
ncbi:response regulator [Myxococcota bacterium]|nr:response regulator [Myxococcota bacterium]